jgi:hypothetical protein
VQVGQHAGLSLLAIECREPLGDALERHAGAGESMARPRADAWIRIGEERPSSVIASDPPILPAANTAARRTSTSASIASSSIAGIARGSGTRASVSPSRRRRSVRPVSSTRPIENGS